MEVDDEADNRKKHWRFDRKISPRMRQARRFLKMSGRRSLRRPNRDGMSCSQNKNRCRIRLRNCRVGRRNRRKAGTHQSKLCKRTEQARF